MINQNYGYDLLNIDNHSNQQQNQQNQYNPNMEYQYNNQPQQQIQNNDQPQQQIQNNNNNNNYIPPDKPGYIIQDEDEVAKIKNNIKKKQMQENKSFFGGFSSFFKSRDLNLRSNCGYNDCLYNDFLIEKEEVPQLVEKWVKKKKILKKKI